jgi:hypothetical protein
LESGFTWEQDYRNWVSPAGTAYNVKYYRLRFNVYATPDATIHPEFHIERFYHNELTAAIDRFKIRAFGEILISKDKYVCLNAGWNTDKIRLSL